ncbi:AraC family transcriptional regulator [Azonexus caeni]|jgi:AraC-like DNA-binding protein|uniref:AraC family transcriptional regulator n=1 Tax=Azonexus caeni TaxID=266126 RepID=UPI003A84C72A
MTPAAHKTPQPAARNPPRFHRSPALPFVEARSAADSQACYRPHAHAEWSVGAVDAGHSRFATGGASYRLAPGDLVLIPPAQVHACNPEDRAAWGYRMLYLDAAWMEDFLATSAAGAAFAKRPWQLARDPLAYERFGQVFAACHDSPDPAPFAAALGELLATPGEALPIAPPAADLPPAIATVRDWLDTHCDAALPLAELAARAGLSPYQLIRRFVRHTGMTPHAYQLDRRIQRARRLLAAGTPICDTALATGFADQSHFHRSFRERVAATPGQYAGPR